MRPIYAIRLIVFPRPDEELDHHHDCLVDIAHQWIVVKAAEYGRPGLSPDPSQDLDFRNPGGACRGLTVHSRAWGDQGWRAEVTHPYTSSRTIGDELRIRAEIQILTTGAESTVTIRLLIGSSSDTMAPDAFDFRPPRIAHELLKTHLVQAGNVEIRPGPWRIGRDKVPHLVDIITRNDRMIPIVVISRTEAGTTLVDADRIAHELVGLAQVVELADHNAAYTLSEMLDKELSAYNGAVRVYWPRFSIHDDRYHHRLYPPAMIERDGLGSRMHKVLLALIAGVAAWRIGPYTRVWEMEREQARERDARRAEAMERLRGEVKELLDDLHAASTEAQEHESTIEELNSRLRQIDAIQRERVEDRGSSADDLEKVLQLVEAQKDAEIEGLKIQLGRAADEVDEKQRDIFRLESRLQAQNEQSEETLDALTLVDRALCVLNLRDVLDLIEAVADPEAIVFADRARESADASPFHGNYQSAFRLLAAVGQVAARYHAGDLDGEASFRDAFNDAGEPGFASFSSPTTLAKYQGKYEFKFDDNGTTRTVTMSPHVGFGSGKANSSVKVYWYVDEESRRFIVGHVGEHLPIASRK